MKLVIVGVLGVIFLASCGAPTIAEPTVRPISEITENPTPRQEIQVVTVVTTPTPSNPTVPAQPPTPAATEVPTLAPTAEPSPTVLPVLCQADWTNGNNGWGTPQGWRISGGMLFTDGKSDTFLLKAPCTLTTPDYAVEADIEAIPTSCVTGAFGLTARSAYMGGYTGCYTLGIATFDPKGTDYILRELAHKDAKIADEQTYRLEVRGNTIKLLVNGGVMVEAKDNSFLDPGEVGIWSKGVQITVSRFKVIGL